MAMKNIEMFDIFVGYIFKELYESFPVPLIIETQSILKSIPKNYLPVDDEKELLVFSETMFVSSLAMLVTY